MHPRTAAFITTGIAGLVAIFLAKMAAEGSYALPAAVAVASCLLIAWHLTQQPSDLTAAGLILAGYLIGNRGFAQLGYPGIPLFPGEFALLLGVGCCVLRSARGAIPLVSPNATGASILIWIIYCGALLTKDLRAYKLLAVRDFAVVYYSLFFFFSAQWVALNRGGEWIRKCLLVGLIIAPVTLFASLRFESLLGRLQLFGNPLIFIKTDSAAGILAGGAAWASCLAYHRKHRGYAILALVLVTGVIFSNSRAGLISLLGVAGWLAVARYWTVLKVGLLLLVAGGVGTLGIAVFTNQPFYETEAYRTYERLVSVVDFSRTHVYRSSSLGDKADNNEFRLVWWQTVVNETMQTNPLLGNGFGYDLSKAFIRNYLGVNEEEFTARAPHNVLLTLFGRTGFIGVALFAIVVAALIRDTYRATNSSDADRLGLYLWSWAILLSAFFGVVLEGPMAAIIFWTTIGLAQHTPTQEENPSTETSGTNSRPAIATCSLPV